MNILNALERARSDGRLIEPAAKRMAGWLDDGFLPAWATAALRELVRREAFGELNDRFFRDLEFGTGGMRGRTIGRIAAEAETGTGGPGSHPARAAVGSNMLNDFNIIRATIGLFRYVRDQLQGERRSGTARLVIAHDVRYFSRHFCELAASTWAQLGGEAFIFDGARSTPQLSFAVRRLKCHAGIVITASHNPPHDNGFKVYYEDGGQVVEPHAAGIIAKVECVSLREIPDYLDIDLRNVQLLSREVDAAYEDAAGSVALDPDIFRRGRIKVVYSPIHGVGAVSTAPLLERFNISYSTVVEQMRQDPAFSTVKSPNPENAEALEMAIAEADRQNADIVLATDPDCDRMGVAARGPTGRMELLTGNQIGSLMAEYRITRLKELGWLPKDGSARAALIKTFVTTELQAAIASRNGIKVINTLTGFKWIAAKLFAWERRMIEAVRRERGESLDYDSLDPRKRAELLLDHSTFYVFGGEESYGYLGNDLVRDKDGNAAVLMFCEVAAAARAKGRTVMEQLDEIYTTYGFHLEMLGQIYYEGALGAAKIRRILESYRENPPRQMAGAKVIRFTDFGRDEIRDAEGERIPPQNFYFLELDNGCSYAVRGSGTEPKIKFYMFGRQDVGNKESLDEVKRATRLRLGDLRDAVERDAASRAEG